LTSSLRPPAIPAGILFDAGLDMLNETLPRSLQLQRTRLTPRRQYLLKIVAIAFAMQFPRWALLAFHLRGAHLSPNNC
jgi:hypothetical protein